MTSRKKWRRYRRRGSMNGNMFGVWPPKGRWYKSRQERRAEDDGTFGPVGQDLSGASLEDGKDPRPVDDDPGRGSSIF